jgi:hypothetical protein
MGNSNGGHRPDSAQGDRRDSSSRNPLRRGSNASLPTHNGTSQRAQLTSSTNRRSSANDDDDVGNDHGNSSTSFAVPQPPPPPAALHSVQTGSADHSSNNNNNGNTNNSRARRVSVAINSEENPPHQTPQRLAGFRRLSTADSLVSNNDSFASHGSSLNARPRLTLGEARELLLSIFLPRQGQLECIASGFLTAEHYALMRGFWAPFLTKELRDKWYLDAVMLSVLGKDRWRSSRQQKEIIMSVAPSREQVLQLNQQQQEYNDQLRERLLDLCGSLVESHEHHAKKTNLQALLDEYHQQKEMYPNGLPPGKDGASGDHERGLRRTSSEAISSTQHQEMLSLSLMRLQTTVSTSFDCFELLASRIPTAIISSLPSNYFLNSTPVVYEAVAFQEKKVGDLDTMSFFVSIESRRRLLHEQAPDDSERLLNTSLNEAGLAQTVSGLEAGNVEGVIKSARQLYAAVRHAGFVVTTACSSLVLTVMFQLAEVLRARQAFRDNRAKAAQLGITLEQLIGRKEATVRTYSGKPIDDLEELKRYAITDEMSLPVLTQLLIERFKKENRAKMEKLRKRFPNLFAYLEVIAPPEEQEDFDVMRLLGGMVLKLMFLTGGGQRSIVADDRRVPGGVQQLTDDVAISNMLEVPILNRICWVACMMGMPIMSNCSVLAQKHQGKPLSYIELDECCGVIRKLFQAVGALPCGNTCPHEFKKWFPLFPFYAVNAEGKRVLMYLYMVQVSAIQRVPLTIQKDMTLLSFAAALQAAKGQGRVDIANYFFEPTLTVGYNGRERDSESNSMSVSVVPPPVSHTTATGPASPLAPKSIAGTLGASASPRSIDAVRLDRAPLLSTSVNGSAGARVMPASLNPAAAGQGGGGNHAGASATKDNYQYMTAVSVGSPTSMAGSKVPASKSSGNQRQVSGAPGVGSNSNNPSTHGQPQKTTRMDDQPSSPTSSASLSCSTLLEDDRDIDVYTCVNPQTQLYMRCSNEATLRRHRATELTPSVNVTYLHSQHEVQAKRPDIAAALQQAVPKLMPSEGFLVVRWTSAEPLVTFCSGDIISAMAERTSSSSSSGGANSNNGASSPLGNGQQRTGSARYFTGATRPSLDGGDVSATNPDESCARAPVASPRVHTVTIDDSMLQDSSPRMARLSLSDRAVGISPSDHTTNSNYDSPFTGYGADDDAASSSTGSYIVPEKTRMYQGLMHELLGVKEKVSRRLAVRWNVVDVLPSNQLAHRTRRLSSTTNINGSLVGSAGNSNSKQAEQYRNEVVLHVAAPEMPVSIPLRIITIGHERAAMSVFTFVSPDSDSVCWANPRLIEAIVNRGDSSLSYSFSGSNLAQGPPGGKGPNGILCNTEEELHNVFFSIGVLLSNAIVNGVYFSAPIAPLAFLLMKKALASGDYSFKSFMWLEPADGNLLNPALVLNSAYEILTMTDQQYIAFLQSRGMANNDALVFPVMHSLLDEVKEDRVWQSTSTQLAAVPAESSRRSLSQAPSLNAQQQQQQSLRINDSCDSASFTTQSHGRERSLNLSQMSSCMHEYMKLIQLHNRRGSTFRRSQAFEAAAAGGGGGGAPPGSGMPHTFLMSPSVTVQDRLQGYRTQQQQQHQSTSDATDMDALYAKLPSRREYLFLYLVNDLVWGSVRRDGIGEKNKELWVSMARGFMTSAVAKSPLMTNCCSRIIREVLCVARPGG